MRSAAALVEATVRGRGAARHRFPSGAGVGHAVHRATGGGCGRAAVVPGSAYPAADHLVPRSDDPGQPGRVDHHGGGGRRCAICPPPVVATPADQRSHPPLATISASMSTGRGPEGSYPGVTQMVGTAGTAWTYLTSTLTQCRDCALDIVRSHQR